MCSKFLNTNALVVGDYYDFTIGTKKYNVELTEVEMDYNRNEYIFARDEGDKIYIIRITARVRNMDHFRNFAFTNDELTPDELDKLDEVEDIPETDVNKVMHINYGYPDHDGCCRCECDGCGGSREEECLQGEVNDGDIAMQSIVSDVFVN